MARRAQRVWAPAPSRPALPDAAEKRAIIAACEALIRDTLKPRDLPDIVPTAWNYPIDIHGAYAGGRYRFMVRYRSGSRTTAGRSSTAPSPASTAWGRTASMCSGCGTRGSGGACATA